MSIIKESIIKKRFFSEINGFAIPVEPWVGSVQSIYSKAVNLLYPSGILISIVNSRDQMTECGILIINFRSFLSCISIGSQFSWENSIVVFSGVILDLGNASVWTGTPDILIDNSSINFPQLKKIFIQFAVEDGLSPIITKKAGNIYSISVEKIVTNAFLQADLPNGIPIDLSPIIGMGIGFTPSGDDFITGVMLYEFLMGIKLIDRTRIQIGLFKTTAGSRTLLQLALKNSFPFYLKQFTELISTGASSYMKAVRMAVEHGSTSGSDSLSGFIWAAEKNEKTA